jgi:putative ABC transport system substrate-binding protein
VKRREFITLLGGAAVWPLAARAQQPAKLPTIGLMGANTPQAESQWIAAFGQRLRELGWIEGRSVAIEYRWAEGRAERAAEIAAEFIQRKVDIIVTYATTPALAAKHATSTIPIVLATSGDPVGTGLVASLARPGGNITGFSVQQTDLAGKKLELLRELVPDLRRLAILANVASPNAVLDMREVQAAAKALAIEVIPFEIRRAEDIAPGFEALKGRVVALYVVTDPLIFTNRAKIHTWAMGVRLPTIYAFREYTDAGG